MGNVPPTITIGIPVYNGQQFLKDAVNSVLKQSYADFELIITDDGSTDSSLEVLKSFNDRRIILVSDGKNIGLPGRLNQQIEMARGKYFFRMDADDIMFPTRIEEQLSFLENNNSVDVVGAKALIINEEGQIIYQLRKGGHAPQSRQDIMSGNVFVHPTVAGKTEWFKRHLYDEKKTRSQDFFLWLNTVETSNFALMDKPLLFYRITKENVLKKFVKNNRLMRQYFWDEYKKDGTFSSFKNWMKQVLRRPEFYLYHALMGDKGSIKRRYDAISDDEKQYYNTILEQVI